jgi:hypothetical protein
MKLKSLLNLATTLAVFTIILLRTTPSFSVTITKRAPAKQIYELVVYHIKDKLQEERMDKFLSEAYLPAVHRKGIKMAGVFKTLNIDTAADKKIYVLLTYRSLAEFQQISKELNADKDLAEKGKDYVDAAFDNAPYIRKESILMESFSGMPVLRKPQFSNAKSERIYELRSYESATEKLYRNKLSMFNDGNEMAIFDRIGSQPVFYGEVLAGSHMPNLMYMTTYSDKKSREEHWKAFGNDPNWKKLSAMPEYQHNVAKVNIEFLVPAEYSDL